MTNRQVAYTAQIHWTEVAQYLGGREWNGMRFPSATQNGAKFKFMNYFWNFPFNIFKS
jgi:hypothetical protein